MSQISLREAVDLIEKLFAERLPLCAFFESPIGVRASVSGFLDSATRNVGLVVSVARPPSEGPGWINVPFLSDTECEFSYGEKRELPEEIRRLSEEHGESCLVIRFLESGELFALFFTL